MFYLGYFWFYTFVFSFEFYIFKKREHELYK